MNTHRTGMLQYLKDHWLGRHSLCRAVFINFLPLFCVLWWMIDPLIMHVQDDARTAYIIALAYCVVAFLVVLPWQAVGVMRSCERYLIDYGNPVWGRLAQTSVLVALVAAVIATAGAVQRIGARQSYLEFEKVWEEKTTRTYDISRIPGTRLVHLKGDLQNGITRKLEGWLTDHADIEGIVLDSIGGRVYEGRGVARVITEKALDTYSSTGCYSACTNAFIAGAKRYLVGDAQLGFHQYKYDSVQNLGYLDASEEQEKDKALYRARKIDEQFVDRVFSTPDHDMWFPEVSQLLHYGVIHAVIDRGKWPHAR